VIQFRREDQPEKGFALPTELVLFAMMTVMSHPERERLYQECERLAHVSVVPTVKL